MESPTTINCYAWLVSRTHTQAMWIPPVRIGSNGTSNLFPYDEERRWPFLNGWPWKTTPAQFDLGKLFHDRVFTKKLFHDREFTKKAVPRSSVHKNAVLKSMFTKIFFSGKCVLDNSGISNFHFDQANLLPHFDALPLSPQQDLSRYASVSTQTFVWRK